MEMERTDDTIVALASPYGRGGIGVVRMSGPDVFAVLKRCWVGGDVDKFLTHTVHLGWITDTDGEKLDQVVVTIYRAPSSYTGENIVEISCHGSPWIEKELVNRLVECGARVAEGGEFTRRAFMNGRIDLAQAEGVADMISATSRASARLAATQLRGEFSKGIAGLRSKMIDLGSLLELELDFSEEDVEFADRRNLLELTLEIRNMVRRLAKSFKTGNAFKSGVPVAIVGIPNVGKSTLLNALVGEEKAIVSDIPGTTRDVIEDTTEISGILFRFYDTAGIRESENEIEEIGVERARKKIEEAYIVLYLIDPTQPLADQLVILDDMEGRDIEVIRVLTKSDLGKIDMLSGKNDNSLSISAKTGKGIDELKRRLVELTTGDFDPQQELIVTNARHYEALIYSEKALNRLSEGIENGLSADFLAQDLREAVTHLGEITGEITTSEILQTIFERYCIGK